MRARKMPTNWRNEYKAMEQAWMALKDQYSEVALALGFPGIGFWGDPIVTHQEVVSRAKLLAELKPITGEKDK